MIKDPKLPLDDRLAPYWTLLFNNNPMYKRIVRKMYEARNLGMSQDEIFEELQEHCLIAVIPPDEIEEKEESFRQKLAENFYKEGNGDK